MDENRDASSRIQGKEKGSWGRFAQNRRNGCSAIEVSFNNTGYRDGLKSQELSV